MLSRCAVIAVCLPLVTLSLHAQRTGPASGAGAVTLVGCVVDESAYAIAAGLERFPDTGAPSVQLVLMLGEDAASSRAYVLTGTRERDAGALVGTRVELNGTLEAGVGVPPSSLAPPRPVETETPATGAAGVTARGDPAHEPGDAAAGAGTPAARDRSRPAAGPGAARPASLAELPRLNVTAVRGVGGRCAELPVPREARREPAAAPRPEAPRASAPAPAPAAALRGPVTVVGCLVRITAGGSAQSPADAARDGGALAVTRASVSAREGRRGSAVPGSAPSGGGSGTVGTSGARGADAPLIEEAAFYIEGGGPDLAANVGRRVAIVGTVRPGTAPDARPDAHTTAPSGTLIVESFGPSGGACR